MSEPTIMVTVTNPEGVVATRGYVLGKNVGYKTGVKSVELTDPTGVMFMTTKTLCMTISREDPKWPDGYRDNVFLIMDEAHILSPEGE